MTDQLPLTLCADTMAATGDVEQRVRRLSSVDASRADLYGGPNVVVPPKQDRKSVV